MILAMILVLFGHPALVDEPKPNKVDNRLYGEWQMIETVQFGRKVKEPDEEVTGKKWTIEKDKISVVSVYGTSTKRWGWSMELDTTPENKCMDLTVTVTEGLDKGKVTLWIYKIEKDTLTICGAPPGRDRPTNYESNAKNFQVVCVFKRVEAKPSK